MASLETLLDTSLEAGGKHLADAGESLELAQAKIFALFDQFSQQLVTGSLSSAVELVDPEALRREMQRFLTEELRPSLQAALDSTLPVRAWAKELGKDVKPHLESVRRLHALVKQVRSVVLLVDDDDSQLKSLAAMLKDEECEIITAKSGTAALNEVRKRRPDLIFLDVELPDLDGVEVLRRLQASAATASVPVIMVSGNSERQVVMKSLGAGARGFIVKPFNAELLIRKLNEVLRSSPPTERG